MPISATAPRERRSRPAFVRRHLLTCSASLVCLIAMLPAAHAHDDDEIPTPERIFWGAFFFVLTLIWLAFMAYQMSRPTRKRGLVARHSRSVTPRWLRWLARESPQRPPHNASRQVRRAFYRKRR